MNSRRFRVISIPISHPRETAHQQAIELGRISQRSSEPFTTRQPLTPLHQSPVGVKTRTPSSALAAIILGCYDAHSTSESGRKPKLPRCSIAVCFTLINVHKGLLPDLHDLGVSGPGRAFAMA